MIQVWSYRLFDTKYYENLPYLKNDSDMYYHFIAIMKVLIIENVMMEILLSMVEPCPCDFSQTGRYNFAYVMQM